MSDLGIKVSLPGIDAGNAPDYQLAFNSDWPNIKIFDSIHIQTTKPPHTPIILLAHNLGFTPAFIVYDGGGIGLSAEIIRHNIAADAVNIYDTGTTNSQPVAIDVYITIYYLDIATPYAAPSVNIGTASLTTIDRNFGIKLAKAGRDAHSHDLRDFVFHSSARSPMVHAVVPFTLSGTTFSYTHNLPFTPVFFAYYASALGVFPNAYTLLNGFAGLSTSGSTITLTGLAGDKGSIVILKDPFAIDSNVITVNL